MLGNRAMTKTETPDERDALLSVKFDEESSVRCRTGHASPPSSSRQQKRVDSSRPQRLARALRFAELLLDMLPPDDRGRNLLELAIKRRDEALLEGVLKELHRQQQRQREDGGKGNEGGG